MLMLKKIRENARSTRYSFLGIKFSIRNKEYIKKEIEENKHQIKIQDEYDLTFLNNAKFVILFLTPGDCKINGGVMSIFSLCSSSRKLVYDATCVLSTYPHDRLTYATNSLFTNDESVLRFSQVMDNLSNVEKMIIHIPEYIAHKFVRKLSKKYIKKLKEVKNLHINILNQNCELMPKPDEIQSLFSLTNNVTQTLAHDKSLSQQYCNLYQIPTHLFSVNIDLSKYKTYEFKEKDRIIVLSPDVNEYTDSVKNLLEKKMLGWKIVIVNGLSFFEYMDLIAKAYFVITFGEGMDGYFIQPIYKGTISIAVYNDSFFPSEDWKDLQNVYTSYDELLNNIVYDLTQYSSETKKYYRLIDECKTKIDSIYSSNKFFDNLVRFYENNYDLIPEGRLK